MADAPRESGPSGREPNLELPSLRLGRGRRKKAAAEAPAAAPAAPPAPPANEPAPQPIPEPIPEPTPEPTPEPIPEPTQPRAPEQRIPPPPVLDDAPAATAAVRAPQAASDDHGGDDAEPVTPASRRRARRSFRLPSVPGSVAAPTAGVVCGLAAVGLAALAADGCSAVRGVGGCGSFGLAALVAILAIEVLLGAALLRLAGLRDTTSTSFLGVGLVAVLAMLFFLDEIDSPWMLLVIPVLSAAAFWLSWWVTAHFVDEAVD